MGWFEASINYAFADANGGERVDWENRDSVLNKKKKNGLNLSRASKKIKNNRDVVLAAVLQNGMALRYASEKCRADREIVTVALEQTPDAFEFVSPKLQARIRVVEGKPIISD